jgi:tRNA-specific 2-thiouridylase
MNTQTIGVAMSGGVDSTVTAGLLLEQGCRVHGFFMLLPLPGLEQQISRVRLVTDRLQIPLHLVDLRDRFKESIISYFTDCYRHGLTPNPCIVCNKIIKCGLLMDEMAARGMDRMATGHYARIVNQEGQYRLQRAVDPVKDQSYFLCRLSGRQLDRLILPLGEWEKTAVFERAQTMGFSHFNGNESQDVCFLADKKLAAFLAEQGVKSSPGKITTENGEVVGSHHGIWKYTVGQRRGLGLPDATPWYVIGLDAAKNRVIIGKNDELFLRDLQIRDVRWAIKAPKKWTGFIQLRSRHHPAAGQVLLQDDSRVQVRFNKPQRAITPGQFAVFYQDNIVLGSGIIDAPNLCWIKKQ